VRIRGRRRRVSVRGALHLLRAGRGGRVGRFTNPRLLTEPTPVAFFVVVPAVVAAVVARGIFGSGPAFPALSVPGELVPPLMPVVVMTQAVMRRYAKDAPYSG